MHHLSWGIKQVPGHSQGILHSSISFAGQRLHGDGRNHAAAAALDMSTHACFTITSEMQLRLPYLSSWDKYIYFIPWEGYK